MTTTLQDAPPQKCSLVRACFPLLALALGAVLVTGVWLWPVEDMPRLYRVLGTYAAVGLTVLLSLLWLLFFSPFSRSKRLLILVGVVGIPAGGFAACVRKVDFYGDLVPIITWRWDPTAKSNNPQLGAFPKDADLSGARPTDFPEYRGRQRDGVVNGPDLARDWSVKPPRKLWRQPNHPGHSGFAIANGAAVTLEQRDDQEAIVCYDVATGQERWLRSYTARFKELLGGEGPRSTPTIRNGEVYSLGATGKLVCLDAASGKENWMADVLENNKNAKWGLAGSPLVFEDKVVVNPGAQTPQAPGTLAAYDRKTGKRLWASGQAVAGYSSPMLATLSGKPQILLLDGEGLSGYAPADGKELWRHPWPVQEDINVAQPVFVEEQQTAL